MEKEYNIISKPKHYNREGGMECIDEMILVFGKEAVKHFCLCNAWKYRYRAADKNGEEDLKKSDWYLNKYKELNGDDVTIKTITTPKYPPITPVVADPIYPNPTPTWIDTGNYIPDWTPTICSTDKTN